MQSKFIVLLFLFLLPLQTQALPSLFEEEPETLAALVDVEDQALDSVPWELYSKKIKLSAEFAHQKFKVVFEGVEYEAIPNQITRETTTSNDEDLVLYVDGRLYEQGNKTPGKYSMTVLYKGDQTGMFGSFSTPDGKSMTISGDSDNKIGFYLKKTDPTRFFGDGKDALVVEDVSGGSMVGAHSANPPEGILAANASSGAKEIDLLIAYTPELLVQEGALGLKSYVLNEVKLLNSGLKNSGLNFEVRLLDLIKSESNARRDAHGDIDANSTISALVSGADFADVRTAKKELGADLVSLFTLMGRSYCGLGYIYAGAAYGYSTVGPGCTETLAHEVGHNLGCNHNPANVQSTGYYHDSRGHTWHVTEGDWRRSSTKNYKTIMSYPKTNYDIMVNHFSNPDVLYQGQATGVANTANNARTINLVAPYVANYSPKKVDQAGPIDITCGNGTLDSGEECDDGNNKDQDGCNQLCQVEECGNARVDHAGEQCDDGNSIDNDACRNDCILSTCGNGYVNHGEECDDGNRDNYDSCRTNCTKPYCGDLIRDEGEACDGDIYCGVWKCLYPTCYSWMNPSAPKQTYVCEFRGCGNGYVNHDEICDDGNDIDDDECSNRCTRPACGNGQVDLGEECDDGNSNHYDSCTNDCIRSTCGNGHLDPGELCDDGNILSGDGCSRLCRMEFCGDGVRQVTESCDDGNKVDGDECSNMCVKKWSRCGNGVKEYDYLNPHLNEECDDGNKVSGDGCFKCKIEDAAKQNCGNAVIDSGESCDDGNKEDFDGCSSYCQIETCGNASLESGEECDDGNNNPFDGCSAYCRIESCGNGSIDSGEICDDPEISACPNNCRQFICGDGVVEGDEQCDEGQLFGDECRRDCVLKSCGNSQIDLGEACDDGNEVAGDGCFRCRIEPPKQEDPKSPRSGDGGDRPDNGGTPGSDKPDSPDNDDKIKDPNKPKPCSSGKAKAKIKKKIKRISKKIKSTKKNKKLSGKQRKKRIGKFKKQRQKLKNSIKC